MKEQTVLEVGYLEEVMASIGGGEYTHEHLCAVLFGIVDEFCDTLPARATRGRPPIYEDRTILKIVMLMHLTGKRGETEILREIKRHYRAYFAQIPGQGRLWHRIRAILPRLEQFRRHLANCLGVEQEELRVVDTMPIPVAVTTSRRSKGNGFVRAEGGYCASKKLSYTGFKLGLLMTTHGIPARYELFSARPHDLQTLQDLVGEAQEIVVLADKGFISDPLRATLAEQQQVYLVTYRRSNQKAQNSPLEQWALHTYRSLIETVFSQLDHHMHIQDTGAKTDLGLAKRIMGILTAFTCAIYLNFCLGRPLLAIKELFA